MQYLSESNLKLFPHESKSSSVKDIKLLLKLNFPIAYISVYTVAACTFRVHFLELNKYSFHPYTKIES